MTFIFVILKYVKKSKIKYVNEIELRVEVQISQISHYKEPCPEVQVRSDYEEVSPDGCHHDHHDHHHGTPDRSL